MISKENPIILRIYFALVSFVTLIILIFSVANLINIGLKTYIFTMADQPNQYLGCDEYPLIKSNLEKETPEMHQANCDRAKQKAIDSNKSMKQKDLVRDISMILVSLPIFIIHFRVVYKEWKNKNQV